MINFALSKQLSDDNTKPSRVKRRLKRRWKRFSAQGLLTCGLTQHDALTYSNGTGKALSVGFSVRFRKSVQSPLNTVVFLCQKISTSFKTCKSIYGVIIWRVARLAVPFRGTENSFNHAAQLFSVVGGLSLLRKGFTA